MSATDVKPLYDLFVSYSQADRGWVEGYLLDALQDANVSVISELNFTLGAPRISEFERAVQQSKRTLLVLSPAYLAEAGLSFVDLLAQQYGLDTGTWPVIPLVLSPVELPPRLALLVALDATAMERWPEVITRLCDSLRRGPPAPAAKPPCPYPGMRAFRQDEADHFYGREAEVDDLIQRLRLFPFVAVIGASGSGKSSLVLAGLVPALRRTELFGAGSWLVRTLRPARSRWLRCRAHWAVLRSTSSLPLRCLPQKLAPSGYCWSSTSSKRSSRRAPQKPQVFSPPSSV